VDRYLPARIAVAKVTLRSVLAPVNIRMAILALLAYAGEHKIGVAVFTLCLRVHSTQREASLGMIELRHLADRRPPFCGVTILTGNLQ
jgi:hypothetical protein